MVDALTHIITDWHKGNTKVIREEDYKHFLDDYPCFVVPQLLKAIHLHQDQLDNFETHLADVAIRIPDRTKLYDLTQQIQQVETKPEAKSVNKTKSSKPAISSEKVKSQAKKKTKRTKELEELIETVQKVNKKKKTKSTKVVPKKQKVAKQTATINSFTDWLKTKNQQKEKQETTKKTRVKKEESLIDAAVSNEAALILEAKKSSHLLEDFIVGQIEKKQHKIADNKQEVPSLVSETYALLLIEQEKYQEAITVYKELSIKYPKKRSTFATQIENLNRKI